MGGRGPDPTSKMPGSDLTGGAPSPVTCMPDYIATHRLPPFASLAQEQRSVIKRGRYSAPDPTSEISR